MPVSGKGRKAQLSRTIIEVAERERRHLGQALHDTICQSLGGIALMAKVLSRRLAAGQKVPSTDLDDFAAMTDRALEEARTLSRQLLPVQLEAGGLMAALEELAAETSRTLPCVFDCPTPVLVADSSCALALYRIAEEGIRAALQHSGAKRIALSLSENARHLIVRVQDDGRGLATGAGETVQVPGGDLMHHRAEAIGATLVRQSPPGAGTTMICSLPRPASE